MLTIQEVGSEILSKSPRSFYVFVGDEYGIKMKYVEMLKELYGNYEEYESVELVLTAMKRSRLIQRPPTVYVVRYDDEFISNLSESTEIKINRTNITGTIVCIYESKKHTDKLAKYLPNHTVSIDSVDDRFVRKYLKKDFPTLADNFIDIAIAISSTYGQAQHICYSMSKASADKLSKVSKETLKKLLGYEYKSTDEQIKLGIAAKDFKYLNNMLEGYSGTADNILYDILSVMLDIEKLLCNPRIDSPYKDYLKYWTAEDVYYMFDNTYSELKKLRSLSYSDPFTSVIYLFGILQYSRIPSPEVMV